MGKFFGKLSVVLLFFLIISCASSPPEEKKDPVPEAPVPTEQPLPTVQEKEPEIKEPEIEPEAPKKESAIKTEDAAIEITQEEYSKTFEEVEGVIEELNSIIRMGDFHRWTTYLTSKFTQSVMNPENLERVNEQPVLKRNKIVIKTLSDYFTYVVAPSRASVRLDDLVFTDLERVKAFMIIRDDRVLIYQLEKISGKWKISTW